MKTRILIMALVSLALLLPGTVMAQQMFDFYGMAQVPSVEGESLAMYGVVRDGSPTFTTPLPLDFLNYEYTLVVTDLVLDTDGNPQVYSGGMIAIYQDDATLADYTNPGSFTDGLAILTGVFTNLNRWVFTSTMGNAAGLVDWTGGNNINDIAPEDQTGWAFLSPINLSPTSVEPGYDEVWDGKVEPVYPIVDVENVTWDELKALF
ncbi:MAG: hypothetical protein KOO60_12670 [Gemmatimonadales bacterium]|nr:hypothetical protein [Gemmatimonadales bacterium]